MEKKGYLFAHFTGEQKDGEQIYFSLSRDLLHWEDLNGGKPVLRSEIGEKGARDTVFAPGGGGRKKPVLSDCYGFEN